MTLLSTLCLVGLSQTTKRNNLQYYEFAVVGDDYRPNTVIQENCRKPSNIDYHLWL